MAKLKFSIRPSFVILCLFVALIGQLTVLLCYCISVLLHEVTHFLVARKFHYSCSAIHLTAFGAVLYGDFEQAVGRQQILIALSAPLFNLFMAGLTVVIWYIYPQFYLYSLDFAVANLVIGLINLLPCYPLDGGKVLVGILSKRHTYKRSMSIVCTITVFLALTAFCTFVLAFLFSINLFSLGMFAVFLFGCSLTTTQGAHYSKLPIALVNSTRLLRGVRKQTIVISHRATLQMLLTRMESNTLYCIEVVGDDMVKRAIIDYNTLQKYYEKYPLDSILSTIIAGESSTNTTLSV
ncbi:MAG: site-2 protease family protein [Clostridia bacterium]|nr:site-2 protease family protein [Clostridia bacterium]